MIIHFPLELLKAVLKAGAKSEVFRKETYRGLDVDSRLIEIADFPIIKKVIATTKELVEKIENRRVIRKLTTVEELSGGKEKKIGRLETLAEALVVRLGKLPNKWLFRNHGEWFQPSYIESVKFVPSSPYTPQHVAIHLVTYTHGRRDSDYVRIDQTKIKSGVTITELLQRLELFPETDELRAEHAAYVAKYNDEVEEEA